MRSFEAEISRRRGVQGLLAVLAVALVTGATLLGVPPRPAQAANAALFDAGNIISDQNFFNTTTMSANDIQAFLNGKVANCSPGYTCLKDYTTATGAKPAVANRCNGYASSTSQTAATIIWNVSQSCGINPQVLIVLLQKEQGLVTSRTPSSTNYRSATGYGCPDTAACDSNYYGFFNQVYQAAYQFESYRYNSGAYNFHAGQNNVIQWNPNPGCGASTVYIQNVATAGLYNYTPYRPNTAAMNNLYGTGDGCSSYGNRNFWAYYNDWFGPSTVDVNVPFGYLDTVMGQYGSIFLGGWVIDPNTADSVSVHVYVDGVWTTAVTADNPRADVGAAYPADGPNHGYNIVVPAATGVHNVCVYAINIGLGLSNPLLRCGQVTVLDPNPSGVVSSVTTIPGSGLQLSGWAADPESSDPIAVHVYTDGKFGVAGTANIAGATLPVSLSAVGTTHGYSITVPSTAGTHTLCAYAINAGFGSNVPIGCATGSIMSGTPRGSLDSLGNTVPGTQLIAGWSFDPDTTSPIPVHVYVDGAFVTALTAGDPRPDIAAAFPGYGASHGFNGLLHLAGGSHQVCAYGINTGPGVNQILSCRTLVVPSGSPIGSVDAVAAGSGSVYVAGWAIDPDVADPINVHVYVDGSFATQVLANGDRPDVGAVFPGYGTVHGFSAAVPVASGVHNVCVYGINVGIGSNSAIRCATVKIP